MAEPDTQIEENAYAEETRKDAEAIEAYLNNVYSLAVPRPPKPTSKELSFWTISGLESSIFAMSSVGSAVLSAIRTGGLFFLLEILLMKKFNIQDEIGNSLGIIAMISSLLAFEGFLIGYGLVKGRRSGRLEVSQTGMWISLVTVIAAGIFSSLSIVNMSEIINLIINVLMAIITGGAAAFVAFYSSENFGYILNHYIAKRNEILEGHQAEDARWRDAGVQAYKKSSYNIRSSRSASVYGNKSVQQPVSVNQQPASSSSSSKKKPGEMVREYIVEKLTSEKRFPSPKEIGDATGVIASTVYYAVNQFVVANQVQLREGNFLSDEDIEKSINALAKKDGVDPSAYRKDV
jgi:hypothetical protein